MREKKKSISIGNFITGSRNPERTAKKAHALGGLTAPLAGETGAAVTYGAGGEHFLKLIAQGIPFKD